MTWQRIDENTYIDDTLVTCAEYQLFIDEMREQGKYYQPDHWTSYQFQEGQARGPILGVRHEDALAFYEWLTGRENSTWRYRTPIQDETEKFPIKRLHNLAPLGYWINMMFQKFVWISVVPENARGISRDQFLEIYHVLSTTHDLDRVLHFARNRVLDLVRLVRMAKPSDFALNFVYNRSRDYDFSYVLGEALKRTLNQIVSLANEYSEPRGKAFDKAFDHALNDDFSRVGDRYYSRALTLARPLIIYVDIVTLQERIAGRSPAFEGIRLVKERIR